MDGSGNVPMETSISPVFQPTVIHSCKYRHALPEGYVYKSRAEREAEAALREQDRNIDRNMMRLENIEMLVCDWTTMMIDILITIIVIKLIIIHIHIIIHINWIELVD